MTDPYQPDPAVICPYDSNHRIAASRLQKHLVKCSRNYPPDYKVTCPYNATHRLFKSEVQNHISSCPDHQHVDPIIYEYHDKHGSVLSVKSMDDRSTIDCQESWDEDDNFLLRMSTPTLYESASLSAPVRNNNTVESRYSSVAMPSIPIRMRLNTRPPRGLPEAMMMEVSGDSTLEDIESVSSFMGVGRGKPWNEPRNEFIMKMGRGRGSAQSNS